MPYVDMHIHSTFSDGSDTPEELAQLALKNGIIATSLTDHDTIEGCNTFVEKCTEYGIESMTGVEVSAISDNTLHILGYFPKNIGNKLYDFLAQVQKQRESRTYKMLTLLQKQGLIITEEDVYKEASSNNISRAHMAKALVSLNYATSIKDAFDRFLGPGCKAYVSKEIYKPDEVIEVIRNTGGVPVLAHPYTTKLGRDELDKFVRMLTGNGLLGIEAFYPEYGVSEISYLLSLAEKYNLIVTGGSDYHGRNKTGISIGTGRGSLSVPYSAFEKIRKAAT